jgi:hypothetical protein
MVGKKVEGNEDQRRAAAREARREGTTPSALKETTGASKQPGHRRHHEPHEEKVASIHQGKQSWEETVPDPEPADDGPIADFSGRGGTEYTEDHARVFTALTMAQEEHNGEAVYLDVIADGASMPEEKVRTLLHDLITVQRLVTELQGTDNPDLGPRFEVKPRL